MDSFASPRRAVLHDERQHVRAASADTAADASTVSIRALAATMIGLGIVGLAVGDFALVWQRIPIEHLPGQTFFAYATAAVELLAGIGLMIRPAAALPARVLFVLLLAWAVLLKLPAVVAAPAMEATWLGFGEIAVMLAGAWVIFAAHSPSQRGPFAFASGARGIRCARVLFALSLPMIGLSHFFYAAQTAAYVPKWIPFPIAWAYVTGAGSILACLAIAFSVCPRLAATLEAVMLGAITLLVWGPGLFALPPDRTAWTAFLISSAIACGAWVVADSYRGIAWLAVGAGERSAR